MYLANNRTNHRHVLHVPTLRDVLRYGPFLPSFSADGAAAATGAPIERVRRQFSLGGAT